MKRRLRHVLLFGAAGLLAALVVAGCAPASRYRVLSFFFDGVPVPAGVEPRPGYESSRTVQRQSSFRAALAQLPAPPPPPPAVVYRSIHQPVVENRCRFCHNPNAPMDEIVHDATLCDACHGDQRREEGWDHGPINLGTCIPCHVSHKSPYDSLLTEPMPDLCLHCHDREGLAEPDYHQVETYDQCTTCHDPHRMY